MYVKYLNNVRIDIFLCIAVCVVVVSVAAGQFIRRAITPRRVDVYVCGQFESLFGSEIFSALIMEYEEQNPDLRILIAESERLSDIVLFDDGEFMELTSVRAQLLVSFMDLFFYNIDILQGANRDRPPRTRAEFLAAARAVAGFTVPRATVPEAGIFPLALGLDPSDPLALRREIFPWVWAAGGELLDESGELSSIAAETIAFFLQLNREGLVTPGSFEKTGEQRLEEFAQGSIAMLAASSRDIPFVQRSGINFGVTAMPQTSPGGNRLGLSGIYAGISAHSVRQAEAWHFITFIAEKNQVLAQVLRAVPGSMLNYPDEYIAEDPYLFRAWDIFEAADIVEHNPADPSTEYIIREMLEELR